MKKSILKSAFIMFLFSLSYNAVFAVGTGDLFKITPTGGATASPVSITLCLNVHGKYPISCQNYITQAATFSINTTLTNHRYRFAGIKINTSGYKIGAVRYAYTSVSSEYYMFEVSDTKAASVTLNKVASKTPVLFVASTLTQGNFNIDGKADMFCATAAQQGPLFKPSDYIYNALIVTSTRYPCNYLQNTAGCGSGYASNDWPLLPNTTYYYPDEATVFNTTNSNRVFDGSNSLLHFQDGSLVDNSHYLWIGIQSLLANSSVPPTDVVGWAYSDLNPGIGPTNDGNQYNSWSPRNCFDWTNNTGPTDWNAAVGLASLPAALIYSSGSMPIADTWGNEYIWQNNTPSSTYFQNVWSNGYYLSNCTSLGYVVCVASTQ